MLHTKNPSTISRHENIPQYYLRYMLQIMLDHGVDILPFLPAAGLTLQRVFTHELNVSREQYYQLLSSVLGQTSIPAFGLKVGLSFSLGDYGALGYACLSSQTLQQASDTYSRFQSIAGNSSMFKENIEINQSNTIISVNSHQLDKKIKHYEVEMAFGQWLKTFNTFGLSHSFQIHGQIRFQCPRPAYAQFLKDTFRCPILYNQSENEIISPIEILKNRLTLANPVTHNQCKKQCESTLKDLLKQHGIKDEVKRLIINQPDLATQPQAIADHLNISYRTLRRRLSEENTSFKDIQIFVRMTLASEYLLNSNLSSGEISHILGYSDATNFHRAFKSWSNSTPGSYRKLHKLN